MRALRLAALVVVAMLAAGGWAQDPEPEEPGGIVEDEDRARIEWADDLRYDPVEAMYYLTGNVVFSHQDIKLYCDEAVYDYDENSAVATGNPRVETPETTMTGDVIEADFDDEVAVIAGSVTAITQRKKEGGEEGEEAEEEDGEPRRLEDYWEKKTTITCDRIVYEYAEEVRRATATERVKAVQEDKTAYADKAVYEENRDLITLTGDVRVLTERGDEFRCPKAVISVEEDWIRAEHVTGVGKRREDEEEQPAEESAPGEEEPAEGGG